MYLHYEYPSCNPCCHPRACIATGNAASWPQESQLENYFFKKSLAQLLAGLPRALSAKNTVVKNSLPSIKAGKWKRSQEIVRVQSCPGVISHEDKLLSSKPELVDPVVFLNLWAVKVISKIYEGR